MGNLRICRGASLHSRDGRWRGGRIYDNDGIRDRESVYNSDGIHDLGQNTLHQSVPSLIRRPNILTAEGKHDRQSWRPVEMIQLQAVLNDTCRIRTAEPKTNIAHGCNDSMLLDIEVRILIEVLLAQWPQADHIKQENLG
jgi:hypothetical protein